MQIQSGLLTDVVHGFDGTPPLYDDSKYDEETGLLAEEMASEATIKKVEDLRGKITGKALRKKIPASQRKSTCKKMGVCMGILLAAGGLIKGMEVLVNRPECQKWDAEAAILDWEEYGNFTQAAWRKWEYKWNCEVNCKSSPEQDFCQGWMDPPTWINYPPKDNLPVEWRIIDPEWCDTDEGRHWVDSQRFPGMPLTCFARAANKTREMFAVARDRLTAFLRTEPFACALSPLRTRGRQDYSNLDKNYT
jgi:hypothetical protein